PVVGAVGVADPDVVVGRAAVTLAVPGARAAHVSDLVALRREHPFASLEGTDAPHLAAGRGHRVQLIAGRVRRAACRGDEDVFAVGRPAGGVIVRRVVGQAGHLAALGRDDEDVIVAVAVGGEGDLGAVGAEDGGNVVAFVHGDGLGDAANGLDDP